MWKKLKQTPSVSALWILQQVTLCKQQETGTIEFKTLYKTGRKYVSIKLLHAEGEGLNNCFFVFCFGTLCLLITAEIAKGLMSDLINVKTSKKRLLRQSKY